MPPPPRVLLRLAQQEPARSTLVLQDGETLATHGIFYSTLLQTQPQAMEVFWRRGGGDEPPLRRGSGADTGPLG